ncbi:MAG: hypothetical protein ACI9LM_000813 [Alteromonadaceae bacterium]|jgi:hypothetical protein
MKFRFVVAVLLVIFGTNVSNALPQKNEQEIKPRDPNSEHRNALVISGGISLGVYEAGVNHVIVEATQNSAIGALLPKIEVTTGSSAGGINALATAIRTCLMDDSLSTSLFDNIFRDIWIDVGIGEKTKNLLPIENSEYQHLMLSGIHPDEKAQKIKDAIFSRKVFENILNKLKDVVKTGQAKEECDVSIGLMVTLAQPNNVDIPLSDGKIFGIVKQSYAIPIRVKAKKDGAGVNRISFSAIPASEFRKVIPAGFKRNIINLPSKNKEIQFDSVLRASLASSAFPGAFGPIMLGYCDPDGIHTEESAGICPQNEKFQKNMFIDGGYFNNVPIGLAAELMSVRLGKNTENTNQNFMYLDPDNMRWAGEESSSDSSSCKCLDDEGSPLPKEKCPPLEEKCPPHFLTLAGQLNNLIPGILTLRKRDLYNDMDTYFIKKSDSYRIYSPTERGPHLTGNFLGAFGAFFDPAFREYDYAAGVYDGLRYVANAVCLNKEYENKEVCEVTTFSELFEALVADSGSNHNKAYNDLVALVGAFICDDLKQGQSKDCSLIENPWQPLVQKYHESSYESDTYFIYKALQKMEENKLDSFLTTLRAEREKSKSNINYEDQLEYMLYRQDYWQGLFLKRITKRLIYLEKEHKGENEKLLTAAYLLLPQDLYASYNIGNAKDPELLSWKYKLIPDHFGIDAIQTGLVVGWSYVPNWDHKLPARSNAEFGISLHAQIKDKSDNRVDYMNTWAGIRFNRPSTFFSSWGVSVSANKNISNTSNFGNDVLIGAQGNVSFLSDKIRFSIGTRDAISNYDGEDWNVQLTFTNIDDLIWAFW